MADDAEAPEGGKPKRPRRKRGRRTGATAAEKSDTAPVPAGEPAPPPPAPEPAESADEPPRGPAPDFGGGAARPLPRGLLLRPIPRRLPPIEREVELKADPSLLPIRRGSGRGESGRGRGGRGRRGRGEREPRADRGPAPAAPATPAELPPPPGAGGVSEIDRVAPPLVNAPEPSYGPPPAAAPHPPASGGDRGRDDDRRGGRRRRRGGRGRGRDRDREPGRSGPPPGMPFPVPPGPVALRPPPAAIPPAPTPVHAPAPPPTAPPPGAGLPPGARQFPGTPAPSGPDLARWLASTWKGAVSKSPARKPAFRGSSGAEKPPLAVPTADLLAGFASKVGFPGEFPFTRGVQATMYRGRPWTMRQYAGFASAAETNRRFRYLLERGQTGLSIAFDLPTQIGYDSDDPRAEGEVGKVGVPINSLRDMEAVLDGIPLDRVTVSMTINATAPILVAMVAAVAKRRGVPLDQVGGTVQNDLLKEFVSRNTWRFPVEASLRLTTDLIRFCVDAMPRWNPISVSGYHMREAGCTASQEVAFTLGHGLAYLDRCVKAGVPAAKVAPRMSFFFAAQMDLLEEVAKFRAARRLWARLVRERFQGDDAACRLRFHTQTAGVALTSAQPEVNAIRVAIQALAAVLGGTQSLHTNSRDEALGLPTEESVLLALRTQQVIAEESGVADFVDPLGGAPLVEAETDRIEEEARGILREMDGMGGPVEAARKGWTQARIAEAAWRHQKSVESGDTVVVGVNRYTEGASDAAPAPAFKVDDRARKQLVADLERLRSERSTARLDEALFGLEIEAGWASGSGGPGLMPAILRAVEAEATVGEICRSLEKAFGAFDPSRP